MTENDDTEFVSKSQIKRECHALTDLGVELVALTADQLAEIPMSDALASAITEARNIKKYSAMKRQRQFIGKLIRNEDHEAIQQALDKINARKQSMDAAFKELEKWRDRMISDGNDVINQFVGQYHEADRQKLRQLAKNAGEERRQNKTPTSARKLFKYIREIVENNTDEL